MTRSKRRIIIIAVIVLVVAIISTALVWIYLNTDMLKSNETLFIKYMGKNVENVEEYLPDIGNTELNSLLEQNKYTFNTTVKVNYTQNIGTTLENTDNVINQLKINANGQTDKTNRYQYQDIKLLQKNNEVFRVEYIQNDSIYGLRFSDLFKQYILVENTNLKDFAQKIGYSEEQIQETSNKINWQFDFSDIFSLTEYEKQSLQNKYIGILVNGISKENFSKQSDVTITIDGKSVYTNSYTLTVTKEQLNKIYINILEELKQDEIILSKIENIQSQINNSNLKDEFIAKIENTIDEINKNNIGQDETKIIVYENQKNTVRTEIKSTDYEMNLDWLKEDDGNYIQLDVKEKDKEEKITLKNATNELNLEISDIEGINTKTTSLTQTTKVDGEKCSRNTIVIYNDGSNKAEATIQENMQVVNEFEELVSLDETNSIKLNDLEEEKLKGILEIVEVALGEKIDQLKTTISQQDLTTVLETLGIMQEEQKMEVAGVTETEKNRFNSQFEMLKGENLKGENILNLIEATKENLTNFEVVSNTELKLKIERNNSNEEIVNTLTTFIEENKNRDYNVDIEYDDETGLVNYIVLTIVTKK